MNRINQLFERGQQNILSVYFCAGHPTLDGTVNTIKALEEAGINIDEKDLKIVQIMHRKSGDESIDYFLYANKFSGDVKIMEPNKCDELSFYELDKFPKNVIPYIETAISNYKNNVCFAEYGF